MKKKFRRFEVLLPARFNDGQEVPDELLGQAVIDVMKQFNAVTFFNDAAEGYWQHEGKVFHDSLGLLVVDVPDTAANRNWMKVFKARLADFAKRKEIVTKLLEKIPGCDLKRPKNREIKDNLSRIVAGECIIQWDEADEPEPEEVREKGKKALNSFYPKLEKLAAILKPLCEAGISTKQS